MAPNKPKKRCSSEWLYFIRLAAAVVLATLAYRHEPQVARTLLEDVVRTLGS